jgi:hypothetical protein
LVHLNDDKNKPTVEALASALTLAFLESQTGHEVPSPTRVADPILTPLFCSVPSRFWLQLLHKRTAMRRQSSLNLIGGLLRTLPISRRSGQNHPGVDRSNCGHQGFTDLAHCGRNTALSPSEAAKPLSHTLLSFRRRHNFVPKHENAR